VNVSVENPNFDLLKGAIRTAWIVLDEMALMCIPIKPDWRLNEKTLRRFATAAEQGRDSGEIRGRTGETLAPELQYSSANG